MFTAAFGLTLAIGLLVALTNILIDETPVSEHRGAWIAFGVALGAGIATMIPVILRLDTSEQRDAGPGWLWWAVGTGMTINYFVDRMPIWVRGAVMGLGVALLASVLIGGSWRIAQGRYRSK